LESNTPPLKFFSRKALFFPLIFFKKQNSPFYHF
jgi:hypothetical protein